LTSEEPFANLIVEVLSAGNLPIVRAAYVGKRHVQVKKEPAREVKDWGKALFVSPNILFVLRKNNWCLPWGSK